ncbi:uncharacterized protein [Panulirus ornatus]|uniref:uncharacterized protein n=1 Tax=Panulirus ornatus TaxID=150431 RepID=UPI003A8B5CC7
MKTVILLTLALVGVWAAPQETPSRARLEDQDTEHPTAQASSASARNFGAHLRAGEPRDTDIGSERQFSDQELRVPAQPFNFRFNIDDEMRGVRYAHVAQGDEQGHVQGSYSFLRSDGILQTVNYRADEKGFHPEIVEEQAPPEFVVDPNGRSRFTVALPYAEEYGVEVTAEQLRQYQLQAAQQEGIIQPQLDIFQGSQ